MAIDAQICGGEAAGESVTHPGNVRRAALRAAIVSSASKR
jgi:hypothetical protein